MTKLDRRRVNLQPANVISERVRRVRRETGQSQAECAEAVQAELNRLFPGISIVIDQSDISRIETGDRPVWDYEIKVLATVLGVSSDYLLGLVDEYGALVDGDQPSSGR